MNVSSVRGRDTPDCLSTSRTVACRTLEYVLPYVDDGYYIYVETGPAGQDSVMTCFTGDRRYEAFENPINRSLTFIGLPNSENVSAILSCPEPRERFFFFLSERLIKFNTVVFKNIRLHRLALIINGFTLMMVNADIVDVHIGSSNDHDCSSVRLLILNSTMAGVTTTPADLDGEEISNSRITLPGCESLQILLQNSRFTDVHMNFLANDPPSDAGLTLFVIDCEFTMAADSIVYDPGIAVYFSELYNLIGVMNTSFHDIRFTGIVTVENGVLALTQKPTRWPPAPPSDKQSKVLIAHCTFERNQARPIYVVAPTLNVEITIWNTTFLHNMALGPGGAISLINNILSSFSPGVIFREVVSVYLGRLTFRNNTSVNTQLGGGNVFGSFTLDLYGNGGAIYSTINATLLIDTCIFVDNVAESLGGAIYNERYSGPILINNIFQRSSPRHAFRGDFIFAEGTIIFGENNTFIANTSLPGESVIEFNSAAYDGSIANLHSPNTYAVLRNLEVFCPVGSSTDLFLIQVKVGGNTTLAIAFGPLQGVASRFVVSCVPCESSQYTMQQGRLEFTYQDTGPSSQYNLDEVLTVDNITCRSCPYGAACRKGQVTALQNFWGYIDESDGSLNFLQCADGHCCQRSSECTSYDSCTGNRTGVLCGQCLPGFEHALFTTACVRDVHCNDYWIIVPIVVVAVLYVLFLMYVGGLLNFALTTLRWIRDKCSKKQTKQGSKTAAQPAVNPNEHQMGAITTQSDSGSDPAQATATQSDSGSDPAQATATQSDSGSDPAQATTTQSDSGRNPAQATVIQSDSGSDPAQATALQSDSGSDPAQATGLSPNQVLTRLQDITQHYEDVAYVIRRVQQLRESLCPPQDPNATPESNNVQSGGETEGDREGRSGTFDTGYLGFLFYFFQTVFALNLTVVFTSVYHEERASVRVQDTLEKIFNFRITQLAVGVCIPGLSEATKLLFMPVYVAFLYTVLVLMLGFYKLATAVSGKTGTGNACCARCNDEGKWSFKSRLTYGMTGLLKYTYGLIAEATFTYLTCVSVAGQHVWQSDGSQVCLQLWQWVVLGYAVIYTVPFCLSLWVGTKYLASGNIGARQFILGCLLPLPMLLYWLGKWLIQKCVVNRSLAASATTDSYSNTPANQQASPSPQSTQTQMQLDILKSLRGPYRDDEDQVTIYWEAVVEFRRLIISMLILIPNDVIRLILATLACIAFLIHHSMIQPFHRFQSNIVETISLLGLCIVSVTGILQATFTELEAIPRGTHIVILSVMQWISSLMGFVIILSIVVVELVFYLRYQAHKKKMGM